jgi:Ca2+-binding RTX toxin-like protein
MVAINLSTITRVSVAADGTQGNNNSFNPALSSDGRYVTFDSSASNLVSGDTNGTGDIFLRDTNLTSTTSDDTITRVSVAADGTQGNGASSDPALSSDGRYVTFYSSASNLVSGDTNSAIDVFLRDTNLTSTTSDDTITRVSVAADGTQGNNNSYIPVLSGDGRYVAFYSSASNLVSGDTNGARDIFLRDTNLTSTTSDDTITRVSVAADGTEGSDNSFYPVLSSDGRYVTFYSSASNLVSGDTNSAIDVFLRDTNLTSTTSDDTITRVSVAADGTQGNGTSNNSVMSSDGRYVAFESAASNLVSGDTNNRPDIFLRDTNLTSTTSDDTITRVSVAADGTEGSNGSYGPALSSDGRYVVFRSAASNLVSGDTNGLQDIFLRDTNLTSTTSDDTIIRVSVAADGTQGNASSYTPVLSSDGSYVTFRSGASNLVTGDTNGARDIFTIRLGETTDDDNLLGSGGADLISGGAGNDTLSGLAGNDTLVGGAGNDVLSGGTGTDSLYGGVNNDTISIGTLSDTSGLAETIDGGSETDTIMLGAAGSIDLSSASISNVEILAFNSGGNTVTLTASEINGFTTFFGGAGTDKIVLSASGNIDLLGKTLTSIEEINGSSGADTITGSSGADTILGLGGADALTGGAGNDVLSGGAGNDALSGGTGSDSFVIASGDGGDTIADFGTGDGIVVTGASFATSGAISAGDGTTVGLNQAQIGTTSGGVTQVFIGLDGAAGADLTINLTGSYTTANFSTLGTEIVYGASPPPPPPPSSVDDGGGTTTVTGGADTVVGGDQPVVDGGGNNVSVTTGADGTDNISITGDAPVNIDGGSGVDNIVINGDAGGTIDAGGGADNITINGDGRVTIDAGAGNDAIVINGSGNTFIDGGLGDDAVTGGGGADSIFGGQGNDLLEGGAGGDLLSGGEGIDTLEGGTGADIYVVDDPSDVVIEDTGAPDDGSIDTVRAGISYTLPTNVEDLVMVGNADIDGTGNTSDNELVGNGDNVAGSFDDVEDVSAFALRPGAQGAATTGTGANVLRAGAGNDTVKGGGGNDLIYGNTGNDVVYGNTGKDTLFGGQGDDRAFGGQGIDVIYGNLGNDTLFGNLANDRLFGGAGADLLYGGQGNDRLNGGADADTLIGGAGSDSLTGGAGNDVFVLAGDASVDTIVDFAVGDQIQVSGSFGTGAISKSAGSGATTLGFDTNGDGRADITVNLTGSYGGTFTSSSSGGTTTVAYAEAVSPPPPPTTTTTVTDNGGAGGGGGGGSGMRLPSDVGLIGHDASPSLWEFDLR